MNYTERLAHLQSELPFDYWPNEGEEDDEDGDGIFFHMIDLLLALGEGASSEAKTEPIKEVVLTLNRLHAGQPGLIEIEEQEDICDILDEIAEAAGIDLSGLPEEASIADAWREW